MAIYVHMLNVEADVQAHLLRRCKKKERNKGRNGMSNGVSEMSNMQQQMLFTVHQSAKCNHIVNKVNPKTSETLTLFSKGPFELRLMAPLRLFILIMSIKECDAMQKFDLKFQSQGQFCMYFLYKSPPIHRCKIMVFTLILYVPCTYTR